MRLNDWLALLWEAFCFVLFFVLLGLAAWLCVGCGQNLPSPSFHPNRADRQLFDRVERAWHEAGLDAAGAECSELRARMRIALLEDEAFVRTCNGYCAPGHCPGYRASDSCPWGCAGECYTDRCYGAWPHCWGDLEFLGGDEIPVIAVHASRAEDGYAPAGLLVHGYLHFLGACTGRGADEGHADRAVWAIERALRAAP